MGGSGRGLIYLYRIRSHENPFSAFGVCTRVQTEGWGDFSRGRAVCERVCFGKVSEDAADGGPSLCAEAVGVPSPGRLISLIACVVR